LKRGTVTLDGRAARPATRRAGNLAANLAADRAVIRTTAHM